MDLNHWRDGSGEPLLLIHGLGASKFVWEPVRDQLAAEYDVVAIDMPGFGESPMLPDGVPASPANLAAAIIDFCRRNDVRQPHVVGNSLGGWVALEMMKSGETRSVAPLNPAGLWRKALGPRSYDARMAAKRLRWAIAPLLRFPAVRARVMSSVFARPDLVPAKDAVRVFREWVTAPGYEAANAEMRKDRFEWPAGVPVPVTVGWGTEDNLVARPHPSRVPDGVQILDLPGLGHTPTWDDPQAVTAYVTGSDAARGAVSPAAARTSAGN